MLDFSKFNPFKIQNKSMRIIAIVCAVLTVIIAFRITMNMIKARRRAASISLNRPISVPLGHALRADVTPNMKFSGSLDAWWKADVASKIDARLQHVYVREGDRVVKGQILAQFEQVDSDANLINAKGAYNDAYANYQKTKLEFQRYKELYAQGAISEQSLDNYRFAYDNARGKFESARGNLQGMQSKMDATSLVAPENGIIVKRYYQEGYYAKAATPVFTIADISKLKITVNVPEGNIDSVSVGNEAYIKLAAYPDLELKGTVVRIAPVADLPSHTFLTEISVENPGNLKAGVYATVYLKGVPKKNVLTIPPYAIVMRDDQKTAYVVDEKGQVNRRVLRIGFFDDKYAEVLDGLTEADTIVVGGQNKVREGSKVVLGKNELKK